MFVHSFSSRAVFGRSLLLLTFVMSTLTLHLSNLAPRANSDCKEVLTKNLECPSIGGFPVAGECEYFARCFQTENGVESEVDFCADGEVFVVNRCIKSHGVNDCPQKHCPQLPSIGIITSASSTTPSRPRPHETKTTPPPKKILSGFPRPGNLYHPNKPIFPHLHPSLQSTGLSVHKTEMTLFAILISSRITLYLLVI